MPEARTYRTELTPITFLRRSAFVYPERIAVVHGERRYTYREMERRVNLLASALVQAGLQKHERVAFLSPNTPALLEAHYAVPGARGILVAINTRLTSAEIGYILEHSGTRLLFVDDEYHSLVESLDLNDVRVIRITDSATPDDPYEQFLASGSAETPVSYPEDEEEPISINYTSGTTGLPKGVVYSHRGAYLNALGEVIETGLNCESSYLWIVPMFHCNGWCFTWGVTAVGATHVCLRSFDADRVWEMIHRHGITHMNGAPTVQIMLVNSAHARPLEHPITVAIGGAPPSPTLLEQLRQLNFRPIHIYGLTETYGPITVCAWRSEWDDLSNAEQAQIRARQGQGYVTADLVRVVDEKNEDIPKDGETMGEVVMRGNNVMMGYFDEPDATHDAFRGGWFHSGDLAVWHADGFVELRDRKKDIIISGGENISTIEVEQAILRHQSVLECAVIAVPDQKWGERPKAFVTLKQNLSLAEDELLAFCREQLAHFKCPAAIEFGELPKTSTGKVQKYVLREKEWANLEKRIN